LSRNLEDGSATDGTTVAIPDTPAERRFAIEVPVRALHQGCRNTIAIRAVCLGAEAVKAGEGLCLGAHRQTECEQGQRDHMDDARKVLREL